MSSQQPRKRKRRHSRPGDFESIQFEKEVEYMQRLQDMSPEERRAGREKRASNRAVQRATATAMGTEEGQEASAAEQELMIENEEEQPSADRHSRASAEYDSEHGTFRITGLSARRFRIDSIAGQAQGTTAMSAAEDTASLTETDLLKENDVLRDRIAALEARHAQLQERDTQWERRDEEMEMRYNELGARYDELEKRYNDLEERNNELEKHRKC